MKHKGFFFLSEAPKAMKLKYKHKQNKNEKKKSKQKGSHRPTIQQWRN